MNAKHVKPRLALFGCAALAALISAGAQPRPRASASAPPAAAARLETRCGWFSNPTPANIWLYDREGEWTIGVQGGYQVEQEWDWPEFKRGQWVETNGSHGYGCACMRLRVDKESHHVLEIESTRARPLSACRKDRALNKWKKMLQ
ncbi:MAG TPA: DUF4087 domain-containing protein [Pyrinomonadaceae bacterium]|jgi:hypothetical protein|nr:DUF4087 domain-containing protein [Pyrinomonadaceae bacterium]